VLLKRRKHPAGERISVPPVALQVQTPSSQLTLPGDREAVVGRSADSDIVVSHPRVSRRHVALTPSADGWVARDLSTNGIWHDGQRVETVRLGAGATTLRLGVADGPELTLTVDAPAEPDQAEPDQAEPDQAELETRLASGAEPRIPSPAGAPVPPAGLGRDRRPARRRQCRQRRRSRRREPRAGRRGG
jgi:hypothetical protein